MLCVITSIFIQIDTNLATYIFNLHIRKQVFIYIYSFFFLSINMQVCLCIGLDVYLIFILHVYFLFFKGYASGYA